MSHTKVTAANQGQKLKDEASNLCVTVAEELITLCNSLADEQPDPLWRLVNAIPRITSTLNVCHWVKRISTIRKFESRRFGDNLRAVLFADGKKGLHSSLGERLEQVRGWDCDVLKFILLGSVTVGPSFHEISRLDDESFRQLEKLAQEHAKHAPDVLYSDAIDKIIRKADPTNKTAQTYKSKSSDTVRSLSPTFFQGIFLTDPIRKAALIEADHYSRYRERRQQSISGKRKRSLGQDEAQATRVRNTIHPIPRSSKASDPHQEEISRLSSPDDGGVVSPQQLQLRGAPSTAQADIGAATEDEDVVPSRSTFRTKSPEDDRISRVSSQGGEHRSLDPPTAAANAYTASSHPETINVSQPREGDRHGVSQVLDQHRPSLPIAGMYSPATASRSQAHLASLQDMLRAGSKDLAECASLNVLKLSLGPILFNGINASILRKHESFPAMTRGVLMRLPAGSDDWIMSITIGFDQATSAQCMVNMGHVADLLGAELYQGYEKSRFYQHDHVAIKVLVSHERDSHDEDEREDRELVFALGSLEGRKIFHKIYPKFS